MAENGDAGGANQPQKGGDGRSNESPRHRNADQASVKLGSGGTEGAYDEIISAQLADSPHATRDKNDVEEKPQVGEQAVDTEHDKNDGIVGGEVGEIVVDATLDLSEVVRLGKSLDVQKFGDGFDVGKSRGDRLGTNTAEAIGEVQARGYGIERDANSGHFD